MGAHTRAATDIVNHYSLGHRLPKPFKTALFGDRERYGLVVQPNDPNWIEWERNYSNFYFATQKQSAGKVVNDAGYAVLRDIPFDGKTVLEIGPGDINHMPFWNGTPDRFVIGDIHEEMLERSAARLRERGVPYETALLSRDDRGVLPFDDERFDIIVTFYSLEHLYPLRPYIEGMLRVLKPGGLLVGAIPAEGGFAWGLGRFLTSRRWLKKNTSIVPDKIICWEHPNFADHILTELERSMKRRTLEYWPNRVPSIDVNLVVKFVFEKIATAR